MSHLRNPVTMGPSWQWQVLGEELYPASFLIFHHVFKSFTLMSSSSTAITIAERIQKLFWFRLWLYHAKSTSESDRIIQTGFFGGHVLVLGKPWANTCLFWGKWVHCLLCLATWVCEVLVLLLSQNGWKQPSGVQIIRRNPKPHLPFLGKPIKTSAN